MPAATATRKPVGSRQSAAKRREQVLKAAVSEFALLGLHGTSTEMIAKRAKISQPYIFRLFPTKKDLFLAAIDRCFDRVGSAFKAAAANLDSVEPHPGHPAHGHLGAKLHALGHAYVRLLTERELVLFQMQAYAACSDEDVRRRVRGRWDGLIKLITDLTGAERPELNLFLARGMLMNVVASIGLVPPKAADQWGHEVLGFA
jgi:AcrR family transcriptional regulator